jgi:NitT/TauT family transport system substrate-binding protein
MKRMIIVVSMLMLGLNGVAQARTYKMANGPWTAWGAANAADVKGFWKDAGVDVRVFTLRNPQEMLEVLKNKTVDLAFDMIGAVVGYYLEGMPVKIIAETDWSHGGDKILIKQGVDVAALKTKPIGVYLNMPSLTFFLDQYLASIGLKLSELRLVEMEMDQLAQQFIEGRFNLIVGYDPDVLRAEKEGNGKVVATSATYPGCAPEGLMVLEDVLNTIPPEDLVKMFKGWVKAVAWTKDPANWNEYMQILNTQVFKGEGPYSEADLQGMLDAVRVHDAAVLLERNQTNGGLYTYLQNLHAFLKANNLLKKDFTPEMIFDNTAIVKAVSDSK